MVDEIAHESRFITVPNKEKDFFQTDSKAEGRHAQDTVLHECCPGDRRGDRTTSGHVLITIERILTGQVGQG